MAPHQGCELNHSSPKQQCTQHPHQYSHCRMLSVLVQWANICSNILGSRRAKQCSWYIRTLSSAMTWYCHRLVLTLLVRVMQRLRYSASSDKRHCLSTPKIQVPLGSHQKDPETNRTVTHTGADGVNSLPAPSMAPGQLSSVACAWETDGGFIPQPYHTHRLLMIHLFSPSRASAL